MAIVKEVETNKWVYQDEHIVFVIFQPKNSLEFTVCTTDGVPAFKNDDFVMCTEYCDKITKQIKDVLGMNDG